MPRKPNQANDASVRLLKQYVQKKAGLSCSSFTDMLDLQMRIKKEVGEYLSVQTLNRFFGLIKNDFRPAAVTLNILARYVGYQSFTEFDLLHEAPQQKGSGASFSAGLIMNLFAEVESDCGNEKGLRGIIRNIYLLMEKEPGLAREISPFMASRPVGRKYFFEQFVYVDALNRHYGEGLSYYLMHTKDAEQHLFANSVLCLRYFLNGQHQKFRHYFEKLSAIEPKDFRTMHLSLLGRYFAARIIASLEDRDAAGLPGEIVALFLAEIATARTEAAWRGAACMVAEALLLTREYSLAWQVLQQGYSGTAERSWDEEYSCRYQLLHLYAGFYLNNTPVVITL